MTCRSFAIPCFVVATIAAFPLRPAVGKSAQPAGDLGPKNLKGIIFDLESTTKRQEAEIVDLKSRLERELKATIDQEQIDNKAAQNSITDKLLSEKESTRRDLFTWLVFTFGIVLTTTGWLGIKIVQRGVLNKVRKAVQKDTEADARRHREIAKVLIFCRLGYLYWQSAREQPNSQSKIVDTQFAYRAMISALQAVEAMPKKKTVSERRHCLEAESQYLFHRLMLHKLGASALKGDEKEEVRSRANALFRVARDDRRMAQFVSDVRNWTETYALILRDLDGDIPAAENLMRPIIGAVFADAPSASRDEDLAYYRLDWGQLTAAIEQAAALKAGQLTASTSSGQTPPPTSGQQTPQLAP